MNSKTYATETLVGPRDLVLINALLIRHFGGKRGIHTAVVNATYTQLKQFLGTDNPLSQVAYLAFTIVRLQPFGAHNRKTALLALLLACQRLDKRCDDVQGLSQLLARDFTLGELRDYLEQHVT